MGLWTLPPDLREYTLLKNEGIRNVRIERYEDALWYFFYAAENAWKKFFGFFCDEEIEQWIRQINKYKTIPGAAIKAQGKATGQIRIGHITSLLTDTGGHSRFIYNLIRNHNKDRFKAFFYSTEMENSILVGRYMLERFQDMDIDVWLANETDGLLARAEQLYQELCKDGIDIAVVHMNPSDVSILYALSKDPRPTTIFFHQADIVFSLGPNYFDYHLDYRKNSFKHCQGLLDSESRAYIDAPGISKSELENITPIEREKLGIPEGAILTATVTNIYKILFMGNEEYFKMLESLLAACPDIYHIVIGTGSGEVLRKFQTALNKRKNTLKRVIYLGQRHDVLNIIKSVDIYLDSFPISGGLCTIDAMALKKPIVNMVNRDPLYSIEDMIGLKECLAHSLPEYVKIVANFACRKDYREEVGEKLYQIYVNRFSAEAVTKRFEEFCENCYTHKPQNRQKQQHRDFLLVPDFNNKSLVSGYVKAVRWHIRRSRFLDIAHKRYERKDKKRIIRDCLLAVVSDWRSIFRIDLWVLVMLSILNERIISQIKKLKNG